MDRLNNKKIVLSCSTLSSFELSKKFYSLDSFLYNSSAKIRQITPTVIKISAILNINQWKLPMWKSIKSGTDP